MINFDAEIILFVENEREDSKILLQRKGTVYPKLYFLFHFDKKQTELGVVPLPASEYLRTCDLDILRSAVQTAYDEIQRRVKKEAHPVQLLAVVLISSAYYSSQDQFMTLLPVVNYDVKPAICTAIHREGRSEIILDLYEQKQNGSDGYIVFTDSIEQDIPERARRLITLFPNISDKPVNKTS